MNKKKTSKFGNINIPAEDFKNENVRIQISIKIPIDLLKAYRDEAEKQKKGYQTLIQETLRKSLPFNKKSQLSLVEIVALRSGLKKLESVEHRIHSLEEKLPKFKRKIE